MPSAPPTSQAAAHSAEVAAGSLRACSSPNGSAAAAKTLNPNSGTGGVTPLNPLALHRSFCPWVSGSAGGGDSGGSCAGPGPAPSSETGNARVGWRWCLDVLVPTAGPEEGDEAGSAGSSAFSRLDPAAKLRALLRKIGV